MSNNISLLDSRNLDSDVPLKPSDYLSWAAQEKNLPIPTVPRNCVFAFDPELLEAFGDRYSIRRMDEWPATHSRLYEVEGARVPIAIASGTVGAPFAAMTMEELISCGGRSFLSAGACGVLQAEIQSPAIIIASDAIRDEGTSFHYLPSSEKISLSHYELDLLCTVMKSHELIPHVGSVWSTDALYRETTSKIEHYKSLGVLAVEMEISALAAVAQYRKAKYIGMLYALDSLASSSAKFPQASRKQLADKHLLAEIIVDYFSECETET